VPPRLALGHEAAAAATREPTKNAKNDRANEISTNPTRHGPENAVAFVNDPSKDCGGAAALARTSPYG
jgi:hypothetical protein